MAGGKQNMRGKKCFVIKMYLIFICPQKMRITIKWLYIFSLWLGMCLVNDSERLVKGLSKISLDVTRTRHFFDAAVVIHFFKNNLREKILVETFNEYGFYSVWVRIWIITWLYLEKVSGHPSYEYDHSPVCARSRVLLNIH